MTRPGDEQGFTVIEVLVAVVILAVGIVALVSSSAGSTRMIGRGRHATRGVQAAAERMEILRAQAYATTPDCTALASGTDSSSHGIVTTWTVSGAGSLRTLQVVAGYQVPGGLKADTLLTQVRCL